MKQASLEDFQHQILRYSLNGEAVAVKSNGRVLGYFVPAPARDDEEISLAVTELRQAIANVREQTGLSEDELADLFDLSKPFA